MKWPWRRCTSGHLERAQQHIDKLDQQQPEVTKLARELEKARQRNHFAAAIRQALRGTS